MDHVYLGSRRQRKHLDHPSRRNRRKTSFQEYFSNEFASPAWTPDGKYIIVSKMPFGIGSYEAMDVHVDGGTGVQITKSKPAPSTPRRERHNAMGVLASPDGKYLYYAVRQGRV